MLAVGRLVHHKRFDELIALMPRLRRRVPGARLVIVGDGYCREELEVLVDRLDARDYVELRGRVTDAELVDAYRRAWVVTSASIAEGWGMTITEAAACGTPAVVTRIGGHCDSVSDGESGLLVDSIDELVDSLGDVLTDDELPAEPVARRPQACRRLDLGRHRHGHLSGAGPAPTRPCAAGLLSRRSPPRAAPVGRRRGGERGGSNLWVSVGENRCAVGDDPGTCGDNPGDQRFALDHLGGVAQRGTSARLPRRSATPEPKEVETSGAGRNHGGNLGGSPGAGGISTGGEGRDRGGQSPRSRTEPRGSDPGARTGEEGGDPGGAGGVEGVRSRSTESPFAGEGSGTGSPTLPSGRTAPGGAEHSAPPGTGAPGSHGSAPRS